MMGNTVPVSLPLYSQQFKDVLAWIALFRLSNITLGALTVLVSVLRTLQMLIDNPHNHAVK